MYAPHIGLDTLKFQLHWAQGIGIFCPTLVLSIVWCIRYLISFPELSSVCVSSDRRTHRPDQHIPRLILVALTCLNCIPVQIKPNNSNMAPSMEGPPIISARALRWSDKEVSSVYASCSSAVACVLCLFGLVLCWILRAGRGGADERMKGPGIPQTAKIPLFINNCSHMASTFQIICSCTLFLLFEF